MTKRYLLLRRTIANLAAPAEAQLDYLANLFRLASREQIGAGFCVDELALEFDDMYLTAGSMLNFGEISQAQIDAARPLNALLARWSGSEHSEFWTGEALFSDPRWAEIRLCAAQVLEVYPHEDLHRDR